LDTAAKLGLFADQEGVVVVLLDVDRTVELLRFPRAGVEVANLQADSIHHF
jgi:hypothetical protein